MSKVTKYLESMEQDIARTDLWTEEQAQEQAKRYWQLRWAGKPDEAEALEFRPVRRVWINERRNTVIRRHWDTERYLFDFDHQFHAAGWLRFDTDQDAWYFGVWVNPKTFRTLSYAEGDVSLVVCADKEHYNAEVESMCQFYGEGFECIATNPEGLQQLLLGGRVPGAEGTVYRQDRQKFFVR